MTELELLREQIVACRACPRLVEWRERVGSQKRAAYADQMYWAKPVPGWGDPHARLLIVGLAPAAHGGNRTGRVFTGDRSGDWLFASLYRAGLANQPTSTHRDDGLQLHDCTIAAAVRCAPPGNQPTPAERANCQPFLERELALLPTVRVIVPLGAFAWDATLRVLAALGHSVKPRPRFGHLATATVGPYTLIGCYHPSQQNTFTGKLTAAMLDAVWARVKECLGANLATKD